MNKKQKAALCQPFDVDGIPYYVLVYRKGTTVGRPDLRYHSTFKQAILTKIAK